jgi:hypothetical protein
VHRIVGLCNWFHQQAIHNLASGTRPLAANAYFGINTNTPFAPLDVNGTIRAQASVAAPASGSGPGLAVVCTTGPQGVIQAYNRTASAFFPLILRGTPLQLCDSGEGTGVVVGGSFAVGPTGGDKGNGTINMQGKLYFQGTAYATPSDARLKTNVKSLKNGIQTVMSLRPVTFDWTAEEAKSNGIGYDHTFAGFVADEVQEAFPQAAKPFGDWKNYEDRALIAALVAAVQEQQKQIDSLKSELQNRTA